MKKSDRFFLSHIRDALKNIHEYIQEGKEAFFSDRKTQDAVIRNLEIIGEATKKLSDPTRQLDPQVPWKQISGMRDKMAHDYFGIDLGLVWDVVEKELPSLTQRIDRLLRKLPD